MAEPEIAVAKAKLKQLSGPREAAIALEASKAASARLLETEKVEQQKKVEAVRVRLAAVEREAAAKSKKKADESRRLVTEKDERRKRVASEMKATEARQQAARQQEEEVERVRAEVASELREATAGHDETALVRCLAAAQRNNGAKPDIAAAKATLKKLTGAREAAVTAAAVGAVAAELRGKLAFTR